MLDEGVASNLSLRGHDGKLRRLRSRLVEVEGRIAEWERFAGEVKGGRADEGQASGVDRLLSRHKLPSGAFSGCDDLFAQGGGGLRSLARLAAIRHRACGPTMTQIRQENGIDTALARLLYEARTVDHQTLTVCLAEVRGRRDAEPGVTLAMLLLKRELVGAEVVDEMLARLAQDPTLQDRTLPMPETGPPPGGRGLRQLGPYRFVGELARGGMGAVYEVVHETTGGHYALKTLLPFALGEEAAEERRRFEREAEAMARLDHPHIAPIHAAHLEGPTPYLVQALLTGGTLWDRIQRGSLEPTEVAEIAAKLARGLEHAHAHGILHRDLKPQNVLFDERGEPRLVDFGLAYVSDTSRRLTKTGTVMGTPGYMAPEQARGDKEVDARTDVYGLGALLYCAVTGRPPFAGSGLLHVLAQVVRDPPPPCSSINPAVPPGLESICLRCLEKAREGRYQSAKNLALDLERFLRGAPVRAEPSVSSGVRSRIAVMGAAVLLLLVAMGVQFVRQSAVSSLPPQQPLGRTERASGNAGSPNPTHSDLPQHVLEEESSTEELNAEKATYQGKAKTIKEWVLDLKSPDRATQYLATRALAEAGPGARSAIPALIEALDNDSTPGIRLYSARALGRIGANEAIPALTRAVRRTGPVAEAAATALGRFGVAALESAPALIDGLDSPSPEGRARSAEALGSVGATTAATRLIRVLQEDNSPRVRASAALALGALDCKDAIPSLTKATRDTDLEARLAANQALSRITGSQRR